MKRTLALALALCLAAPAMALAGPIPIGYPYPESITVDYGSGSISLTSITDDALSCTVPYGTQGVTVDVTMSQYEYGSPPVALSPLSLFIEIDGQRSPDWNHSASVMLTGDITVITIWLKAEVMPGMALDHTYTLTVTRASQPPKPAAGAKEETAPPQKPAYEQAKIGRCKEWANVRSGPGVAFDIIGQAKLGETVELLEWSADGAWCRAFYNGGNNIGWIHGRFILPLK